MLTSSNHATGTTLTMLDTNSSTHPPPTGWEASGRGEGGGVPSGRMGGEAKNCRERSAPICARRAASSLFCCLRRESPGTIMERYQRWPQ